MDASLYFAGGIHFVFLDPSVVVIVNVFFNPLLQKALNDEYSVSKP